MEQRISLITLAVDDLPRAVQFYENIGWQAAQTGPGVAAFNMNGTVFGLYPWDSMAKDMGLDPKSAMRPRMTLGYNVREKTEVAQILMRAETLGGSILKPAHDIFWGGHSGFFADPDGHMWEVAFNPFSPVAEDGGFHWSADV
jgi:catechol 2,3-dioxygenase-like lactoylglutathione lyase family enzyme